MSFRALFQGERERQTVPVVVLESPSRLVRNPFEELSDRELDERLKKAGTYGWDTWQLLVELTRRMNSRVTGPSK